MGTNHAGHLVMAALVGASLAAASAYYIHCQTLTQFVEFARTVKRVRERDRDDNSGGDSSQRLKQKRRSHHHRGGRRKRNEYNYRRSSASPYLTVNYDAVGGGFGGEEKRTGPVHLDGIIPAGIALWDFSPE